MSDQRYIKEGWLQKRSRPGKLVGNWRRRYFRLTSTELAYYKSPQEAAPRRRYELTLDSSVLRTNDQGYTLCIAFQAAPGQTSLYMQADNEEEKDEWVTAIYNAYRRTPDVAQQPPAPEMPKVTAPPQPRSPPAPPSRIILKLVVEEARKLKAADMNGKSDPYCVVKLIGKDGETIDIEEKRTDVISATLEPVWNAPFEIGRVVDLNSVKAVRFDLKDHDTFQRHDSLGSVEVPFSRFRMSPASTAQSERIDEWFRVELPKKTGFSSSPRHKDSIKDKEHVVKDWGELHVRMSISGPNLVDFFHNSELDFVSTSPVATVSNEHTDNRLEVTVLAARNLISADVNDSSDPYCELTLLDDHGRPIPGEFATTATMHPSLKVRIVDYGKTNRKDPLGFVLISLDQLSAHKWTDWHALQPEESMSTRENLGEIQLKIWLIGERRGEHARRLKIDKELHLKAHSQSIEQLEYENAQFEMHDAACKLDGARIPCAVTDYQARDPRFYGINGCIHYLNTQIPRAHQEKTSTDEGFQARTGLEGHALLEVTVVQASELKQNQKQAGGTGSTATPYAVIELDPSVCVEECKRTSAPLSPQKSKRIAASEARNTMFSKRTQAEVSKDRTKLAKNDMRSEKSLDVNPDIPVLKVEIRTGHGLSPADMNGYSDPYCTLSITDRTTGKAIEAEKKRTAVISKTLNPVWANENFMFGNNVSLSEAKSLLIHVKDHNNIGRSTPLGRVEIPLYDLCRESVDSTSISSKEVVKKYELKPEPWMKKHAKELGELCIKTEVVGNATALAELLQRMSNVPMEKSLSFSDIQNKASIEMSMSTQAFDGTELEGEKTEILQLGAPIRTSSSKVLGSSNTATWREETFSLSLSYPGIFSDAKYPSIDTQLLQLRVHEAQNLLISGAAGDRTSIGSTPAEVDAVEGSTKNRAQDSNQRQRNAANVYFTVVPVRRDGTLEDAERIQSLTVYNARDPSWPVQEFVFGKIKDISNVSYLSLHLYERDVESNQETVLSNLLTDKEKKLDVCLKRFQLHKLSPSGEVEDDDFELLQFGQQVLAFRGGEDGGRFYPARIQRYIPFPSDEYEVRFDDEINTIDELRNLISLDVEGVVQAERINGRLDVAVDIEVSASANSVKRSSRYVVKPTQLVPVNSLTGNVEKLMARRLDMMKEGNERWAKMQHMISGIVIDVLSASDLVVPVIKDGKVQKMKHLDKNDNLTCRVTLLGKPMQKGPNLCYFNDRGELFTRETMSKSTWEWKTDKQLEATIGVQNEAADHETVASEGEKENGIVLFQNHSLVIGRVEKISHRDTNDKSTDAKEAKVEYRYQPVDPSEAKVGHQILEQTSSILIQVNAKVKVEKHAEMGSKKKSEAKDAELVDVTLGFAKIDLAMLRNKQQTLRLQIVPPKSANVPYYKAVGSLFVRITTSSDDYKMKQVRSTARAEDPEQPRLFELSAWYENQLQLEAQSSSQFTRGMTWIERRQILRTSLSPTENAQIDALHTVLVIIMKRIVRILREIQQFEAFETLSVEEMRKSRLVHTVNAIPGSSKSSQENEQTQQITTKEARSYAKKLTEYCDGFLGMHTMLSNVLLAVKDWKNSLKPPVAENPSDLTARKTEKDSVESPEEQGSSQVVENILWDWKYCLFVPSRKHLYIYEKETSTAPMAFIDVASAACKIAYNFSNDVKGGWMDIVNPTVCVRKPNSKDFVAVTPEILNKMTKTRTNGDKAIEVKTSSTQKWIQALARSGVCVDMRPGQEVLMKRLNPIILQQKCNKHATEFDPNDLEGSFQRLLNRLFGHDKGLSRQDHEKEIRELRAQVRSELKKAGSEGDTVMAYYGKGKNRRSRPVNSGNFKNDSLYSGRILRIRTPFTDEKYQFKTTYDMTDTNEVPTELSKLLAKYKVTDKASWLSLPKSQRDMFLLYDVEYSHANERITEEGLMRGHIRTNEGDLDPQKVSEKCADLNILFKATDLENCVSRMVKHRYRYKPLGVLKIHTKMISPHRTLDAWYPLAPASEMLQRTNLGQIRVEMKLVQKREVTRSAKLPSIPEDVKIEETTPQLQDKNTLLPQGKDVKGKLPFAVGKEPSFVKVSILEGRSLPVADMFTSDPFVEIVLVGEDSKERDTSLKTDIKMKTLNPKWENQEFLLGKTEKTKLSDKKAVLLRVMDYDAASANDPLGCVTIEFQRSETGYIRVVLTDRDSKETVTLTFDLNLVGILRADRVRRLLADTFRLVGLAFDSRTFNHNGGRFNLEQLNKDVEIFLWENCQANLIPGRNVAEELLAQIRIMSQASKLHWKVTPQLLGYVFELVLLSGDNDRLSYANTVALDAVLNRWSRVLAQVTEAKDYLTGNFHGKKTPRVIEALFTECEWTGFNVMTLSGEDNRTSGVVASTNTQERFSPFCIDDRVTVKLPFFKHAGVVADTQLRGGEFVAARIVKECGAGLFNVKICAESQEILQERLGKLKEYDNTKHPESPYLVEYLDGLEPREEWRTHRSMSSIVLQVDGELLKSQLQNEDFVQISEEHIVTTEPNSTTSVSRMDDTKTDSSSTIITGKTRPGKITHSYGDTRFNTKSKGGEAEVDVPSGSIQFDKLHVKVFEASNMKFKEKMGGEGLQVEVVVISSDFNKHMTVNSGKKITTPFGLEISSTGEILPDIYPKYSTFTLMYDSTQVAKRTSDASVSWKVKNGSPHVEFKYPVIDMDRVSEVRLVVRDKKSQTQVGIVTIPMGSINISRSVNGTDKAKDEPIYSVQRDGSDGKRAVVGTLSLSVERIQKYSVNDEVYAKQLETSMDFWTICPKELLKMTLEQHESKLSRSFLAAGPLVSGEGKLLLSTPIDMELQLQKIAKVQMFDAMTMLQSSLSSRSVTLLPSSSEFQSLGNLKSRAMDTLQLTLQQTKAFMKDTAHELGLGHYVTERRLPWSSDAHVDENESQVLDNVVVVEANVATCTYRVQHTVLKLHEVLTKHFIPKLDELYTLNADEDRVDVTKGENLLSFFDTEVEKLEPEDQKIRLKLYQRLRLSKLIQVLDMIMKASVRVKVMDEDRNNVDGYLGTACIPLMDLLDQQPHDDVYELLYLPTTNLRGNRKTVQSRGVNDRGKIRLRLHLKVSESSYFEQAIEVYKVWKAKYIAQHEAARRRIHDTVVPAQRRRWTTMKSYLDELTMQANGKLHWERTPVLLSLVWDIFALQESSPTQSKKKSDADEAEYSQSIATMADKYRGAVMKVHKRWVNLQPKLDELLTIQAATQIHAKRTPEVLDDIEKEIEGLDVGLSTAWKQVKQKWQTLLDVLEELVRMNDGKLNLARAPQLLNTVEQRCSKGLDTRHSDAVSQIQSRWMAITQPNGPLSELQLMEKKGLHWRRTHELLLLLDEQCEGFADVDARALDTVQNRWEQVQEWLHEVVQMQLQHSIDSEHTPFILEKMQLWKPTRGKRLEEQNKLERSRSGPSSQSADVTAVGRQRGLSRQSSVSRVSSDMSFQSAESTTEDNGQLEGMAEWYAIEETKYELERIPYHRITVDADKKNWLPFSRDGKDTRLLITQEEMIFTPANVRLALEDRGVIPKTSTFDPTIDASAKDDAWVKPSLLDSKSGSQTCVLPKHVDEEIKRLEKVLESQRDNNQPFTLPNPERVAELYEAMESLGKTNLLWNVSHAVSRNRELAVPENYQILLREMTIRQIPTTEVENLVKSLAFSLQKETLMAKGITVPTTANPTTLLQLMDEHQIKEVALPQGISSIQTLLEERGMDRKGEPVMLRGIRIGTQCTQTSTPKAINTGLGIIDTQIEALRRTLLFEALRKRNSLVRTFAGESHVLDDETERTEADMFAAAVENAEVDVSGDYLTLVERFQRLLVHESYTKRLAEYAALDRCMRALLGKSRDEAVTKEEIAVELHNVNKRVIGANYRLPPEAFTREELLQAVAAGRIRTPSDEMLSHCPEGENASAMAHYAAISYAANVFQEVTSFRSRVDLAKNRLQDTFPYDECSSLDGVLIPKQRTRRTFGQSIADWLLGFDASALSIKRKLSAAHRQRLEWASAAFTLRNRWLQHGLGWCDHEFGEGVGVKVLLDRLLIFEAANKMDMVKTEKLLREVRDKCSRLRDREQEAQAKLEERYQANLALLEKLVTHAERCMNNRKLHSEETPVLLHKLEQVCVVPKGLNDRHREAYHTVATHWLPHQQHLAELVKMHREGTFSITRTPELLGKMQYHTEGKAGSEELSEDKVAASAQRVAPELQATFVDRKLNEVRLGQRKEPSSLHLNLSTEDDVAGQSADDTEWKELSPSKRVVQPLSPHEKQTSWKVVKNAVAVNAAFSATSPRKTKPEKAKVAIAPKVASQPSSPRRKLSLSEELKEMLRSPTQWLTSLGHQEESIRPELYFPTQLVLDTTSESLDGPTK
ncbi:hypothetical protein JG688_00007554 [Phytophthora aleatoria]|uniref:Uncharacterized protein n=1 Tax=Phytophthora aleatoria TaxID=2496075 RepID=A0A8J5M5I0_9STRA|nr:hypothetical protein JG688_00007554 [Phytophthora aleatoria]